MYMLGRDTIRIGNNAFERVLAHRIATRHGAQLQVQFGRRKVLQVRSLMWLHLCGKVLARVWGYDHLNLSVIGHVGVQKKVARDVQA
jgi:hypothetical protein